MQSILMMNKLLMILILCLLLSLLLLFLRFRLLWRLVFFLLFFSLFFLCFVVLLVLWLDHGFLPADIFKFIYFFLSIVPPFIIPHFITFKFFESINPMLMSFLPKSHMFWFFLLTQSLPSGWLRDFVQEDQNSSNWFFFPSWLCRMNSSPQWNVQNILNL